MEKSKLQKAFRGHWKQSLREIPVGHYSERMSLISKRMKIPKSKTEKLYQELLYGRF